MQVLHITPYMHPSAGGPPVVVDRLLALAPPGRWSGSVITTSLFCSDDGQELARTLSERFEAKVVKQPGRLALGLASAAAESIEQGVSGSDIVHLHGIWHPFNTLARRACARHGRRYLLMPHGMLDPFSLRVKAIRKWAYLRLRERANLEGAERLIFTTAAEEALARAQLPWLGTGEVIPLGADPPPAVDRQILAARFRARFAMAAGRRCLLFLGRIHPKKGLESILAALPAVIAACPDVLLVVAGAGDEKYVKLLRKRIAGEGLAGHVLFTDLLLDQAKWEAFAAAELFLLPSAQENFAIAVAEAMGMGVPVIVSDRVNTAQEIADAGAGIVLGYDQIPHRFGSAISAMLADRGAAATMGVNAGNLARSRYDWQTTARRTFDLYERILGMGP